MSEVAWVEKYRPQSVRNMSGNRSLFIKLAEFVKKSKELPKGEKRGLLFIGPPGTGKTTLVYAYARDAKMDILETNASNARGKDAIRKVLQTSSRSQSLFSYTEDSNRGKIILVDEVDGISGQKEKGGIAELVKYIKRSTFPIVCCANFDNSNMKLLADVCDVVNVPLPSTDIIIQALKRILDAEQIPYENDALQQIAIKSHCDFRAAINDAQMIAKLNGSITKVDMNMDAERDISMTSDEGLESLFNVDTIQEGRECLSSVELDYENLLLHVGDTAIKGKVSYEMMASIMQANQYLRKVMKTQNYSLLPYFFDELATIGLLNQHTPIQISKPLWRSRHPYFNPALGSLQSTITASLPEIYHNIYPYLLILVQKDAEFRASFLAYFNLTEEEWNSLTNKK